MGEGWRWIILSEISYGEGSYWMEYCMEEDHTEWRMKMDHTDTYQDVIDISQGCKGPKKEELRKDKNKLEVRWTQCDASSLPLTRWWMIGLMARQLLAAVSGNPSASILSSICVAVPGRIHLVSIATLSSAAQPHWMAASRERVISAPIHRFPSKHPAQ